MSNDESKPSSVSEPLNFAEVEIIAPGLILKFTATKERISRVLAVVLKEASESAEEMRKATKSIEKAKP